MTDQLYATPVDERTVLVRPEPRTGLRVRRTAGESGIFNVHLSLPLSEEPFHPAELAVSRQYFRWAPGRYYWWETTAPARFRVHDLGNSAYIGSLEAEGRVEGLGTDPHVLPRFGSDGHFFAAFLPGTERADIATVRADPRERDARGEPRVIFSARAITGWRCRFREFGPELLWLRAFSPSYSGRMPADTFTAEAALLRRLAAERPGSAVKVAHEGMLDAGQLQGPFLATRPPVGLDLASFFSRIRVRAGDSAAAAMELLADLAATLVDTHRAGFCLGACSPELLRVRLDFRSNPAVARAMITAAPLARECGASVIDDTLHRIPDSALPGRLRNRTSLEVCRPEGDVADYADVVHAVRHHVQPRSRVLAKLERAVRGSDLRTSDDLLAYIGGEMPASLARVTGTPCSA